MTRTRIVAAIGVTTLVALCSLGFQPASGQVSGSPDRKAGISVHFSPNGGCLETIVRAVDAARSNVRIQAYAIDSASVIDAILRAMRRGVDCEVILDTKKSREFSHSPVATLANAGVSVLVDDAHEKAHNKIVLIDNTTIFTGSLDFTSEADTRNAENLLVIENHDSLFKDYEQNYEHHRRHATKYETPAATKAAPRAPPAVGSEPSGSDGDDITVYVTRTGSKYHLGHCSYLRKSRIPKTLSQVRGVFGPCSRCRPPR